MKNHKINQPRSFLFIIIRNDNYLQILKIMFEYEILYVLYNLINIIVYIGVNG